MKVKTILKKTPKTLEDANQIFLMGASKIGFEPMIYAMASFYTKLGDAPGSRYQQRVISEFLIDKLVEVYELEERNFFESNIREYRQAKWIFFHLLRKYTELSREKIARQFKHFAVTERKVRSACKRCHDILNTSFDIERGFNQRYDLVEKALIRFISDLK